jgi:hypothetical protein
MRARRLDAARCFIEKLEHLRPSEITSVFNELHDGPLARQRARNKNDAPVTQAAKGFAAECDVGQRERGSR